MNFFFRFLLRYIPQAGRKLSKTFTFQKCLLKGECGRGFNYRDPRFGQFYKFRTNPESIHTFIYIYNLVIRVSKGVTEFSRSTTWSW